jgi:hypothetical protein
LPDKKRLQHDGIRLAIMMPANIENIRESPGHLRHKFKRSFTADFFESSLLPYCHLDGSSDFEENRGSIEEDPRTQRGGKEEKPRQK